MSTLFRTKRAGSTGCPREAFLSELASGRALLSPFSPTSEPLKGRDNESEHSVITQSRHLIPVELKQSFFYIKWKWGKSF